MEEIDYKVSLVRDKNSRKAVLSALELLGGIDEKRIRHYPSIFIKPNLCGGVPGEPGSHTSIEVLKMVLEIFSSYSQPLYLGEADCSFNNAHEIFTALKIYELGKQFGAQIINLSEGPFLEIEVPRPLSLKKVRISSILYQSFIVSVSVLKTHPWCSITLNMKNMYGAIYEREKAFLHHRLDRNIVDINKVIKARLCIIDGTTAVVQGGFKYGLWVGYPPTKMDLIISGFNPVAVDAVGTRILGRDPLNINYLQLAAKEGLGVCNFEKINLICEGYSFT